MEASGREALMRRLFDSCHDTLEKMCYRRLHYDSSYAELISDVIQEAFLAADQHWRELIDHPNPEGWLMITCQNRLKDALRKDNRRRISQAFSLDAEGAQPFADPVNALDTWADQQADQEVVARIAQALSHSERQVMQGYFVEGLPMEDVAKRQGSTMSAVKSAIWRIRDKAKRLAGKKK